MSERHDFSFYRLSVDRQKGTQEKVIAGLLHGKTKPDTATMGNLHAAPSSKLPSSIKKHTRSYSLSLESKASFELE